VSGIEALRKTRNAHCEEKTKEKGLTCNVRRKSKRRWLLLGKKGGAWQGKGKGGSVNVRKEKTGTSHVFW